MPVPASHPYPFGGPRGGFKPKSEVGLKASKDAARGTSKASGLGLGSRGNEAVLPEEADGLAEVVLMDFRLQDPVVVRGVAGEPASKLGTIHCYVSIIKVESLPAVY